MPSPIVVKFFEFNDIPYYTHIGCKHFGSNGGKCLKEHPQFSNG